MADKARLRVEKSFPEDSYTGIVRMSKEAMCRWGINFADFVEIKGKRKTVASVGHASPGDIGKSIIRMDSVLRSNAGTDIGEKVSVARVQAVEANEIILKPTLKAFIPVDLLILKNCLLGRGVIKGDQVVVGNMRFMIAKTSPRGAVAVGESTSLSYRT